jgi:hypothetical protein
MSLPITSKPGVSVADFPIHQSPSASAASGILKAMDRAEFNDLKKWASASVEGRPHKLTLGAFEAHIILPNEFMERLRKMAELGVDPTTLKEFETALTTHKITTLISQDKLTASGKE